MGTELESGGYPSMQSDRNGRTNRGFFKSLKMSKGEGDSSAAERHEVAEEDGAQPAVMGWANGSHIREAVGPRSNAARHAGPCVSRASLVGKSRLRGDTHGVQSHRMHGPYGCSSSTAPLNQGFELARLQKEKSSSQDCLLTRGQGWANAELAMQGRQTRPSPGAQNRSSGASWRRDQLVLGAKRHCLLVTVEPAGSFESRSAAIARRRAACSRRDLLGRRAEVLSVLPGSHVIKPRTDFSRESHRPQYEHPQPYRPMPLRQWGALLTSLTAKAPPSMRRREPWQGPRSVQLRLTCLYFYCRFLRLGLSRGGSDSARVQDGDK